MGMRAGIFWAVIMLGPALGAPALAEPRPFELRDGQVVITVTLNGRELPALLDTGATESVIERRLARELGIRSQEVRGGGAVGASGRPVYFGFTSPVTVDIGAGAVTRRIGTYPTGKTFADDGVRLLIGMDLLYNMAVTLDFEKMTVDFQRSKTFVAPERAPLEMTQSQSGRPRRTLSVGLAGTQANLLLDTAASGALHLDSTFVAGTPTLDILPASRTRITGLDGSHEHDAILVPQVTLGGQVFESVRASSGSFARLGADDIDGVVGVDLLKRFNLVIDFGRNRVWMTPRANHDALKAEE